MWLALSVFVHLRLFIFKLFIAHCFFRFSRSGIQNINCFSFGSFYLLFYFCFFFCAIFLFWSGEIAACNIYTCTKYCMKSKLFVLKSFCITVSTYSIYMYIFLFFCLHRVQIYVHLKAVSLLLLPHLELANF